MVHLIFSLLELSYSLFEIVYRQLFFQHFVSFEHVIEYMQFSNNCLGASVAALTWLRGSGSKFGLSSHPKVDEFHMNRIPV